jgi:hypothetical protein
MVAMRLDSASTAMPGADRTACIIEHPFVDSPTVAERLKEHEVEGMARSMAMAPLSADSVARLLASHGDLSHDWAEVEGLLRRLGPALAEFRSILNGLNAVMGR